MFLTRFRREAAAAAAVDGVCTASVLEAATEAKPPYLVTELINGPSLAEHVAADGPLAEAQCTALAVGLAEALVAIDAAGLVHRDLKPSNVLLTDAGPRVIDFGIAYAMEATSLTGTQTTVGSAGYMSPEQAAGRSLTSASDMFAWGATVAYAATGRPPFGEGRPEALLFRVVNQEPDLRGVPAALATVVSQALSKDPTQRPRPTNVIRQLAGSGDATAVTQAFLAQGWDHTAQYGQGEAPTEAFEPPGAQNPPIRQAAAKSRRKVAMLAAAGLLVVAGGVGTAIAMDGGGGPAQLAGNGSSPTPSASPSTTAPTAAPTQAITTAPAVPSPTADAQQQIIDAAYAITHKQNYTYRYQSNGQNPGCNRQPPDLYPKASWQYSAPIDRVNLSGNSPAELTLRNKFGDYPGQTLELDVRAIVISPAGHRSYEDGHVSGSNEVLFNYPRAFTYDTGTEAGTYTVLWVDTQGRPIVCGGFVAS